MAKDASAQGQVTRQRHLNIVYFIDSARTHSIRIDLCHARWIVAGAIGLLLWSIISLGWIISLDRVLSTTRVHLSTVLASVFDYQVKYDKIFDVAYPEAAEQGYYAEGSHLPSNNPVAIETAPKSKPEAAVATAPDLKPAVPTVAKTVAAVPVAKPEEARPVEAEPAVPSKDGNLSIRQPVLTRANDHLNLVFDIYNRQVKNKAEGYVWAVGKLKLADGTTKFIVAPTHAKLTKDGNVENQTTAYRFSIQRYKKKDFVFSVPSDGTWSLSELKVVYSDVKGGDRHEVPIATTIQDAAAKAPEEEAQ